MERLVNNENTQLILEAVEKLLTAHATAFTRPEVNRVDVILPGDKLVFCANLLEDSGQWYLAAITGLDHSSSAEARSDEKQWQHVAEGDEQTGFGYDGLLEVLYHFCSGAAIATLRVQLNHNRAEIPSICSVIPSATLYERELMEMFGISVKGTPVTDHLLLPDDWPSNVYPMRKDFKGFDEKPEPETNDA